MTDDTRNRHSTAPPTLKILDPASYSSPFQPIKRINNGDDLNFFLTSRAYADVVAFLLQLNRSMIPEKTTTNHSGVQTWPLHSPAISPSSTVLNIQNLLRSLKTLMANAPPETGPRRFGNVAFRTWYAAVERSVPSLLEEALPENIWEYARDGAQRAAMKEELGSYLLGSFGSSERLDYGTGHELSFLAFLGCIWKLGGFAQRHPGVEERGIVVAVIQPYLELIRTLILTYTLEPAGSHGVWGLDDHSFLPYIFGSAQYSPPISVGAQVPTEGSLQGSPSPVNVAKKDSVTEYRDTNLYFSAIGFIFDVKSGPFWEHSPTLYDISGIKDGWAKINKGMIKMYNAEVLSKFPVVQHFPFGSLFSWEVDPSIAPPVTSVHANAQPKRSAAPTETPWATARPSNLMTNAGTAAPWAKSTPGTTRLPQIESTGRPPSARVPASIDGTALTGLGSLGRQPGQQQRNSRSTRSPATEAAAAESEARAKQR